MRMGTDPDQAHKNNVNDGGDRGRPQMAHDDANDSQTLAGGDITRCRAFVQRISYLSVLCDSKANCACNGACQEDWTIPRGKTESKLLVPLGLGIESVAKDLGISCGLHLHLDASATMCLVSRRKLG